MEQRIHLNNQTPARNLAYVAVYVSATRKHLGVLYNLNPPDPDNPKHATAPDVRHLHLGWHGPGEFHNEDRVPPNAFWIQPNILPETGFSLAGLCKLAADENVAGGIPYGFGSPLNVFGAEGKLLPDAAKFGLTCASFVLAIFHWGGVPLVQYETWKPRAEDRPLQEEVITGLKGTQGVDAQYIESQRGLIENGQIRFRPLEVACAAVLLPPPIDVRTAESSVQIVEAEFKRLESLPTVPVSQPSSGPPQISPPR